MLVMNTLAVTLPIAGKSTGELSDLYPNLFVPAGFTFAIWSIIYLLLIAFVIYQWVVNEEKSQLKAIGPLFLVNGICNGLWLVAWHYEYIWLSLLIMGGLLFTLIALYLRLNINYSNKENVRWLVHVPISVYLGWISIATVANVTTLLVSLKWTGGPLSQDSWASIMIVVAVILGALMLLRKRDVFYASVVAWATFGIFQKRSSVDLPSLPDAWTEHISQVGLLTISTAIILTVILTLISQSKQRA